MEREVKEGFKSRRDSDIDYPCVPFKVEMVGDKRFKGPQQRWCCSITQVVRCVFFFPSTSFVSWIQICPFQMANETFFFPPSHFFFGNELHFALKT